MIFCKSFLLRAGALYFSWWVLTGGDPGGLLFGVAVALAVSVISCRLYPASDHQLRVSGGLAFVGYFITRSVVAGVDVARRLLSPRVQVNAGYVTVLTRLPEGSPRWLLANTLSLMPGTLSVRLHDDRLELHCIDLDLPVTDDVRATEQKVAAVFGVDFATVPEAAL